LELPAPITAALQAGDTHSLWRVEKALWPLKIAAGVACFVVPIRPQWAMHLFDEEIASGDLFGARSDLVFRGEKVYYCTPKARLLRVPGRILWYVSRNEKIPGSQCIRAASMIEEVVVDHPKDVFRRFRRLGIYEWRDVSTRYPDNVMAIRFSRTELFSHPISFHDARSCLERSGVRSTFQSITAIPEAAFLELYRSGTSADG
jgi:hypothetical protein